MQEAPQRMIEVPNLFSSTFSGIPCRDAPDRPVRGGFQRSLRAHIRIPPSS